MSDRWYFGYRCEVSDGECFWHGSVCVPRCHPVRSVGFDDHLVLLISGEWNVLLDINDTLLGAVTAVHVAASRLRRMQDDWDRLSPYEREYMVR